MSPSSGPVPGAGAPESALFDLVDGYGRAFEAAAAALSLTAAQACVLLRLDEPCAMGALAEELGCDASNVTQIVNRLQALGLVNRDPSPVDRRARVVSRTPDGLRVSARFEEEFSFARGALGRLTTAEQDQLTALLRKALG